MNATTLAEAYAKGEHDFQGAQLSGENLSGLNLQYASFKNADLYGANLSRAALKKADFSDQTNLAYVNLSHADLESANLCGANLKGANLDKANLKQAIYDSKTCFPQGFDPNSTEMILLPETQTGISPQELKLTAGNFRNDTINSRELTTETTANLAPSLTPQSFSVHRPNRRSSLWKKILLASCISFTIGTGIAGYKVFQIRTQQTTQIEEATRLADGATAMGINATTIETLQTVQEKLQKSTQLLQNIKPNPGSLYPQAQSKLAVLTAQIKAIEQKLSNEQTAQSQWTSAHQQAEDAIQLVSYPPYSLENLRQADYNLRQAIDKLKTISSETWIKPKAQDDLFSYESKAIPISKALQQEESADQKFKSASDIAVEALALTKGETFYKVTDLEVAQEKWQKAIKLLKSISPKSAIAKIVEEHLMAYQKNEQVISSTLLTLRQCLAAEASSSYTCENISLELTEVSDGAEKETEASPTP